MISLPNPDTSFAESYNSYFDSFRADTPALRDRVYRLRHQVYCIENAFEDPEQHLDGREIDADDERSEHTLLVHRSTGASAGTARVVRWLTGKPLPIQGLLGRTERQAFEGLPLETTGEISRFAVSKEFRRRQARRNRERQAACRRQARRAVTTATHHLWAHGRCAGDMP